MTSAENYQTRLGITKQGSGLIDTAVFAQYPAEPNTAAHLLLLNCRRGT
jgi:hypothetical protein